MPSEKRPQGHQGPPSARTEGSPQGLWPISAPGADRPRAAGAAARSPMCAHGTGGPSSPGYEFTGPWRPGRRPSQRRSGQSSCAPRGPKVWTPGLPTRGPRGAGRALILWASFYFFYWQENCTLCAFFHLSIKTETRQTRSRAASRLGRLREDAAGGKARPAAAGVTGWPETELCRSGTRGTRMRREERGRGRGTETGGEDASSQRRGRGGADATWSRAPSTACKSFPGPGGAKPEARSPRTWFCAGRGRARLCVHGSHCDVAGSPGTGAPGFPLHRQAARRGPAGVWLTYRGAGGVGASPPSAGVCVLGGG